MELIELGSILHMEKGKKPSQQSTKPEEGFLPYVDIKAFEQGIVDNYANPNRTLLCNEGDLLIVCDGSRSGLTGKAITGIVGSTLSKIYADGVDTDYLRYFIQSKYTLLNTRKKGTGTPHLNADILKKSKLVVPSLAEQRKIVEKIDELFSEIDKAEETLVIANRQLELYRQSVLKAAFGSVNAESQKLEDLCFFITKGTTPAKNKMYQGIGKVPFIKVYNLTFDNTLDFSIDPTFVDEETHTGFLASVASHSFL